MPWFVRYVVSIVIAALVYLAGAPACAEEARVVVVRTTTAAERALLERVRGQVNDLGLRVVEAPDDAPEPTLREQLETADRLVRERHARAVVWFEGPSDRRTTLAVSVLFPDTDRLFVRTVPSSPSKGGTPLGSASLESAALIVRSALRASLSGASVGIPRQEALRAAEPAVQEPNPPAPPVTKPPPPKAPPPPPHVPPKPNVPPSTERLQWVTTVGWEVAVDGHSTLGEQGPLARLGLQGRHWEGGLGVHLALPFEVADRFATVRFARQSAYATGGFALSPSTNIRICTCVIAGAAFYERSTIATQTSVRPSPGSTIVSALVGPELRLSYRSRAQRGLRWGLQALVGADVIPDSPRVVYRTPADPIETRHLWVVEPRAALMFELISPSF